MSDNVQEWGGGKGKWTNGLNEIQYVPGVYGDISLTVSPRKNKGFIQDVTLGINGSVYSKELPILAEVAVYPWRCCMYAGVEIGKRWK